MQDGDTTKNLGPGKHMLIASLAGELNLMNMIKCNISCSQSCGTPLLFCYSSRSCVFFLFFFKSLGQFAAMEVKMCPFSAISDTLCRRQNKNYGSCCHSVSLSDSVIDSLVCFSSDTREVVFVRMVL